MGRADGWVRRTARIVDNGPAERRWNVVIVGDGFTDGELSTFATVAQNIASLLLNQDPFRLIRTSINVFRVDVASVESGASVSSGCSELTPVSRRTVFEGRFCNGGLPRLTNVNHGLAWDIAREQVPQVHVVLVVLNSTMYGGAGGSAPSCSIDPAAALIAIHEMCHSAFGLGDEYQTWRGCGLETDHNVHGFTFFDLVEPNLTVHEELETLIAHKWGRFVNSGEPFPTMRNPDCTQCDGRPSPFPRGTVGLFEGAHYYHCDAYRAEFSCLMRDLGAPLCRACREHILRRLAPFVTTPVSDMRHWNLVLISRSSGKVMDVTGVSVDDGVPVQIWDYHGNGNQRWWIESVGNGFERIAAVHSGKALDVWGISRNNGAPIHQYRWWSGENQQWRIEDVGEGYRRIVARHSGLVIEVQGGRTEAGTDLVQGTWNGSHSQQWRLSTSELGMFVRHTGKALDVWGLSRENGGRMVQFDWWAGPNQKWRLEDVGQGYFKIISANSGKVLEVQDGNRRNGAQVIQWDWHGGEHQQWRLEPEWGPFYRVIARHSGLCLDVSFASVDNGAGVIQWTYVGGWNQLWRLAPAP